MRSILALLGLVAFTAPAWAQKMCNTRMGRARWDEGAKLYDLQRFDDAIRVWEEAYLDCEDPELLFNLAQANRKAGHYVRARDLYRAWLRNVADANPADLELANAKLAELDELIAAGADRPAPAPPPSEPAPSDAAAPVTTAAAPPPTPPSDRAPWHADRWGWALAGAGAAVTLAGAGLLLWSSSLADDAASEPDHDEASTMFDAADRVGTIGLISVGAGAALIAGGIIHFALYDEPRATSVRVGLTGRSVTVSWSF